MTDKDIEKVKEFLRTDPHKFYLWGKWKRKRNEVLKMDHNECQMCKAEHVRYIPKARVVHHVHHLKDRPDLALEVYDENGERNLVSLCTKCHNKVHPEKMQCVPGPKKEFKPKFTNSERW